MQSYSIGREETSNVVVNDPSDLVSRRHATLTVNGRKMTITDHSTNGTYINGIRIASNTPVPVSRGDIVNFAQSVDLDWNMIPRSAGVNYALIAAAAVVVAGVVVAAIYIPRNKKNQTMQQEYTQQVKKDSTDTSALKDKIASMEAEIDSVAAGHARIKAQLEDVQKKSEAKADSKELRNLLGVCRDAETLLAGVDVQKLKNDASRVKENLADGVKDTASRVEKLSADVSAAKTAIEKAGQYVADARTKVKDLKDKAGSDKKQQPSKKNEKDSVSVMSPQPFII